MLLISLASLFFSVIVLFYIGYNVLVSTFNYTCYTLLINFNCLGEIGQGMGYNHPTPSAAIVYHV